MSLTRTVTLRIDLNLFWERVLSCALCERLQIVYDVVTSRRFAKEVFGADSATERLHLAGKIISFREAMSFVPTVH